MVLNGNSLQNVTRRCHTPLFINKNMNPTKFKVITGHFGSTTSEEKAKILEDKTAKNTNHATRGSVNCLQEYLKSKGIANLCHISNDELPNILENFYSDLHTKKDHDLYKSQSMKCMRSNLNRYFKSVRQLDIITDPKFVEANEMFKGMTVQAKKHGRGMQKSTIPIDDIDLKKMTDYFNDVDYMNNPQPIKLQQTVLYNLIFYTCRRSMENLEYMSLNHYKVIVQPDGTHYVVQNIDKLDKNHREDSFRLANEGRMYANPGKNHFKIVEIYCFQQQNKVDTSQN